jgi:hypothetical protein
MSKLGLELLTSNQGTAFPFAENATGVVYAPSDAAYGTGKVPVTAVLDAVLITPQDVTGAYLYNIVPSGGQYSFRFNDQSGALLLIAPLSVLPTLVNGYGLVTFEGDECVIRLVVGQAFNDYLQGMTGTTTFGTTLPFEAATVETRPARLQSVQIYSAPTVPKYGEQYTGNIQLVAGYNIGVDTESASATDTTEMTLVAVPGAGQGVVPCDVHLAEAGRVQRMSSLVPDSAGAVRITGDDCYEIVPIPGLNTIQIEGNCYACCSCDDYVAVGQALAQLMARTDAMRLELIDIHAEYSDALEHYHDVHIPTLHTMYAHAHGIAGLELPEQPGGASRHGHFTLQLTCESNVAATDIDVQLDPVGCTILGGTVNTRSNSYTVGTSFSIATLDGGDFINLVVRVKSDTDDPPTAMHWTATWTLFGEAGSAEDTTPFTRPV